MREPLGKGGVRVTEPYRKWKEMPGIHGTPSVELPPRFRPRLLAGNARSDVIPAVSTGPAGGAVAPAAGRLFPFLAGAAGDASLRPAVSHPSSIRRTLAIISHPDAGKTTLTEKFLLYGGAIDLAGSVTSRRDRRSTTSDWMELEKQRGISVSSTVLQFDYSGFRVNLLDTPGHEDFSEDTYRVLTAVDA